MVWQSDSNRDKLVGFSAELEKAVPSKGSFKEDYASLCAAHSLTPCPFITSAGEGDYICRIANATVDLASWRAALLAVATEGSKITEIAVHACGISPQHILDIVATVQKKESMATVKLEYITLRVADGDAAEEGKGDAASDSAYLPLLTGTAEISYLSLKGNDLQSLCCSDHFYNALCDNLSLSALSLSNCKLDDTACSKALDCMRQARGLVEMCLSQNVCKGACLATLQGILLGAEVTADNDARFKNLAKLIGDKNKGIKDANKGRKKKGLPDLAEVPLPAERTEAGFMHNRAIKAVDVSFCPLETEHVQSFAAALGNPELRRATTTTLQATLILRGGSPGLEALPPLDGLTFVL